MERCSNTNDLAVHHINISHGNSIDNAKVLCQKCHEKTCSYGLSGRKIPPDFDKDTKDLALNNAAYQCECTNTECLNH